MSGKLILMFLEEDAHCRCYFSKDDIQENASLFIRVRDREGKHFWNLILGKALLIEKKENSIILGGSAKSNSIIEKIQIISLLDQNIHNLAK